MELTFLNPADFPITKTIKTRIEKIKINLRIIFKSVTYRIIINP